VPNVVRVFAMSRRARVCHVAHRGISQAMLLASGIYISGGVLALILIIVILVLVLR
jgi:hypothetical protein